MTRNNRSIFCALICSFLFRGLYIMMKIDTGFLSLSHDRCLYGPIASTGRVDPLSYFSFQPVLHDWCNKGHGLCYPVCGMVHIKEPLLLIDKQNVLSASLNKTFLPFF